jgi:prepilin-type N-terminal cleavage/methylation domain-containing protein
MFTPRTEQKQTNKHSRKVIAMKLTSRKAGFTLVEIMIVVAIIGLLAAIAIPNFVRARTTAQTNACINNLRQIDGAKQQWALETRQGVAATPGSSAVTPYLKGGTMPLCPASGSYNILSVSNNPTCNITGHSL